MRSFFCGATTVALALVGGCSGGHEPAASAARNDPGPVVSQPVVLSRSIPGIPAECTHVTSEGESFLAVNPADPRHLQAVWLAGEDFGANTGVAAESLDGGLSWKATAIPGTGPCTGGPTDYVIDGWAALGPDGRAYYAVFGGKDAQGESMQVLAATATGGRWDAAVILDDNQRGTKGIISRTSITADPVVPGRAWAVWSRILNPVEGVMVSRTDDGGANWQAPVAAAAVPGGAAAAWQLLVLPDASLLLIYGEAGSDSTAQELLNGVLGEGATGSPAIVNRAVHSIDGGETWSTPATIVELPEFVIPRAATGPDGAVHLVWAEVAEGLGRVRITTSLDAGATWSEGGTAAEFASGPLPALDIQQDVAVASDGRIGVSFYAGVGDDRIQRRFAWSSDGSGWNSVPLADPFFYDADNGGSSGGTGDGPLGAYQGLAALGPDFGATFLVDTGDPANPTDVLFVRIAVAD